MAKKQDGRRNNGGNKNAGRKPKAEEQKLVEKLSPMEESALNVLKKNVEKGERWAIELYFKYMYGMPKQQTDVTSNGKSINRPIVILGGSEEDNNK